MHYVLTIITAALLVRSTFTQKSWSSQLPNDPFHSNDWIPLPSATFQQQVIQSNTPDGRQSSGRSIHFGSESPQQYTGPQIFPSGHNVNQPQSLFADKSPDIITKPPTLNNGGEGRSILVTSNFHFGTNVSPQQQIPQHISPARENVVPQQPQYLDNQFYQPLNPLAFQHFDQQQQSQPLQPQLMHTQEPAAVVEEQPKPQNYNPFAFQQPMIPGPSVIPQQQEEVQLLYVPLDTLWQHKLQQQQQHQQHPALQQRPVQSTRNFIDPVQINNFYTPQPYTTSTTRKTTTTTTPSPTVFHRFSMTPKPQYFSSSSKPNSQQFSQSPNVYTTPAPLYHQSSASPRFIQTTSKPSLSATGNNYYNQPNQHLSTTPTLQLKKSHQPPLSMFVRNGLSTSDISVADVLSTLRNLNSVDVLDSPGKKSPKVFIGPSNLFTPNGYSKFSLPYLSTIEQNPRSSNGSLQHIPFFVAPQSYRAPKGFAKIPLPAPHIGSFVHSATDNFDIDKTTLRSISRPNVEVNIGSTRYSSSIPTEQSFRGLSSSTTVAPPSITNGFFDYKEISEKVVRPKAEKSIRFRNNQNSFQPLSHQQNEDYFNVKSTVPNYLISSSSSSTTTTEASISDNINPSSTLSYTRNPYNSQNFFHYDSYNNNSKVPALRLQNYNPATQSERPVEFKPSPKSEHDQPDVFRPMTEQPPSPSPQEEYEMKNYFRAQTEFRTPFNDISSTPSYNNRLSSTESNELKKFEFPTYTESNYISEINPEITTKKIVYFPPSVAPTAEQDTFPLNHNEVYRVRNATRSSRPVSRFRYQYSSEAPAVEKQHTNAPNSKEKTENRNYADSQYGTNFASILNPIMNYFTSDGSTEEKSEITTTSAPPSPSIVKEYYEKENDLPKELPAISARLPGMINNLLEEELAIDQLNSVSSTTESYTTTTRPTTVSSVVRRRPGGRRTVPIRTTTPSSERSVTRQTTARGRRVFGQTTSSPIVNDGSETKPRNTPIRSRNVTGISRGSTRARGIVKAKDKKEENWEYQRDELNQNYPSTRIRKLTSNRSDITTTTTTTTTTPVPTTFIPSQIFTTTESQVESDNNNLSSDFLSGVPLQIPEKHQSASQTSKNSPVYEAQRTTMKAQSLNNELFENTPKPVTRRYNFANRAARPTTVVATASVSPVEITERVDTSRWNDDNYVVSVIEYDKNLTNLKILTLSFA